MKKMVCLLCDFKILLTVFNQSCNCQTSHYLGRNRLPKHLLMLPSLGSSYVRSLFVEGSFGVHGGLSVDSSGESLGAFSWVVHFICKYKMHCFICKMKIFLFPCVFSSWCFCAKCAALHFSRILNSWSNSL